MNGGRERHDQPLALTMGDPAGIGPEITIKAWLQRGNEAIVPFAVYADPDVLQARARLLGADVPIAAIAGPPEARAAFSKSLPVIPVKLARRAEPGRADPVNAAAVITSIEQAVADIAAGNVRAVVTNPISKGVLYQAGFSHPGHTEFLAALANRLWPGHRYHPVMMLASDALRVVPLTIHVPLRDVAGLITRALIFETVRITWEALRRDFGIEAPRVAVCGLNPHAGEAGSIGREDEEIIGPAIRDLGREGFSVSGPYSADTLFHEAARKTYDVVIAMYHDQALIPLKTIAFDDGVNTTLGLPFVRTSPDHGTAFSIAAKGSASATSLLRSLKMADAMAARRAAIPA